ncbi:MAG: hypothetical protein V3V05_04880 [Pontiella sp.]
MDNRVETIAFGGAGSVPTYPGAATPPEGRHRDRPSSTTQSSDDRLVRDPDALP